MIKPFQILGSRDEPCGGKTVFFKVSKTIQITDTRSKTHRMETAIFIESGQDADEMIFNSLKDSGWLDA